MGKVSDWLIGMQEDAMWMSRDSWAAKNGAQNLQLYDEIQDEMRSNVLHRLKCCRSRSTVFPVGKTDQDPEPCGRRGSSAHANLQRPLLCEAPQDEIDAAWRRYMYVKRLHREGVEYSHV